MKEFEQKDYKVFEMFSHQLALVTAGNLIPIPFLN